MSHEGIRIMTREDEAREALGNRPLSKIALTPEKVRVLLTEGKGLEIDWADGHKSAWSFAWLRDACPCASAHVHAAPASGERPSRGSLRTPIQLAGWPLRRHLFMGLPAPPLPVPGMQIRRRAAPRHPELIRFAGA